MTEISSFQYLKTMSENHKKKTINIQDKPKISLLCVIVGQEKLYIGIHLIKKVIMQPEITPLANTKHWFAGLLRSDGEIYSATHIDQIIFQQADFIKNSFAIALNNDENIALWVHDVIGIAKVKELNNKISEDAQSIELFENENNQILKLINTEKLINSKEFISPSYI